MTMRTAIEVHDVVKSFPGQRRRVLDGLSFTIDEGEFVVLEGPSGGGKSTTLHLIGALTRPTSGRIVVCGRDIAKHRRHLDHYRRDEVGLVFQLHNLLPHLTVLQNVEIAMLGTPRHRRLRIARARELLAAVGLTHQTDAYPPELSGGERQRVAVARAFANDPPLILADEPTGSLDDDNAALVIALLRDRCAHGGTVLAVSHDARLTVAADRVLRLAGGRIAETPDRSPAPVS
jgi:putative ABC transport system ATP-binding protein